LKEAGGDFGKFQIFVSIVFILSYMTGGVMINGLAYLEVFPDYQCRPSA